MTGVRELYEYINSFAPFDTAMSFDNVGILVGDKNARSEKVVLALDATAEVLREAYEAGAKIVVTHHPVIFNAIKSLDCESAPFLAAKYGITVLSAHTNLDIAEGGVNDSLAEAAGIVPDEKIAGECAISGHLEKGMSCREFAESLKNRLGLSGLRFTDNGRSIKKIMVACGAGGDSVVFAGEVGADAILTGEIKHHHILFANDRKIAVFDLGHFGSEGLIIPKLMDMLSRRFPDTEFIRAAADTDGMIYCSAQE